MDYKNILVLGVPPKKGEVVIGHDLGRPLAAKKAHFLDYVEVYDRYGYKGAQTFIADYIRANDIKCLFNISSSAEFYFDLDFFERLNKDVFIVRCIGDSQYFYDMSEQYYCQTADLVIDSDLAGIYRLKQLGVDAYFCPGAYDVGRYPNKKLTKDIDVSFVGQIRDKVNRLRYVNCLKDNGINIQVYGCDSKSGRISFEEKLDIFHRSKIVLSISSVSERTRLTRKFNIYRRFRAIKPPVFEGIMCGSFVLSEFASDIEEFFTAGRDLDMFYGEKELLEKVRYYLANDALREEIALRGHNKLEEKRYCDEDYHLPNIMAKIDELAFKKLSKTRQPVYVDDILLTNFSSFRVLMMVKFLKKLEIRKAIEELGQFMKYRRIDLYQLRIFVIEEILDVFPGLKKLLKNLIGDADEPARI